MLAGVGRSYAPCDDQGLTISPGSLLHHGQHCRAKRPAVAFVLVGRVLGVTR